MVAVRSRGADLGVLTLALTDARRRFDPADRTVAQDLAARLALAYDNARLYRDARSAVAAREDVLAFVAHDLRNPIHAIQISLADLLDGAPARERRSGWQRLDRVRRVAEQMNRMIDDLLDLSTIDTGQLTIEATDWGATNLIQEANDALGPLVNDKGIRLVVEMPAEPADVRCDPSRVLQVFSNIIGNAVKFTPAGGQITITSHATAAEVVFSVTDTGDGVAPGDLGRLFDRYWQADAHAHKGRGLGLYIAQKIIDAQGGRIWAESERGRGTSLSFSLPRAAVTARPSPAPPAARVLDGTPHDGAPAASGPPGSAVSRS